MKPKKYTIDAVREAVKNNKSIAGVLRELGLKPVGGNYKSIHAIIDENNINTDHFTGQGWNVGLGFKPFKSIPDEKVFVENSSYRCSWRLREKLLKLRGARVCECCGLTEWRGQPIALEVHHINGKNTDNRLENLQILCPNCHSQTKNYRGKGKLSPMLIASATR